jgi:hypothetical protein
MLSIAPELGEFLATADDGRKEFKGSWKEFRKKDGKR